MEQNPAGYQIDHTAMSGQDSSGIFYVKASLHERFS
jgi:hypothetical protein